ncbi:MAG: UDP-2,3-diacylglucosamine diphosphatase [Flavobacteriaceae bacterium]
MELQTDKPIFFASDQHFGAPTRKESKLREVLFMDWLAHVEKQAGALFLLGDLFDFWFEYKKVVPKGFVRPLGKLATMADQGLPIFYFVGNHDLWMTDYFEKELGIPVFHKPQDFELNGKKFLIGHGDGLGPNDLGYKRMKKVITNPFLKMLFRWLHPDIGVALAQYLSTKNKLISGAEDIQFLGEDQEWLAQYCRRKLTQQHRDYFLFGHRHLPMQIDLGQNATYINTGDWITHYTYAELNGTALSLKTWK